GGGMTPLRESVRLPADPEPIDIEDRARSLGFGPDDDLDAFADLERLLPWFEHPMDQHRVRAVWPNGAERLGLVERLPFDPDEYDRERDELAAGTDLGVSRELREASLAEHARRHVRVRAMLAPRTQEDAPILQRREERVARDAWRVPVADGQVALPAPDLFGTRDLLEHQPSLLA